MIFHKFSCGPLATNAILVGCAKTKKAAVIDPSLGSTSLILEKCQEANLQIEKILLTHSHWDHIADVHALQKAVQAKIYVHPSDQKNLEHPGCDGIPLFQMIIGAKPDHLILDGSLIEIGELLCEVIHTPGHSPGSVCFFFRKENYLFSGDTLFEGSIGNLSLPTAQPEKMWDSLRKLSQLPPDTHVVPGHGSDTILARENWLSRAKEIFS